MKLLHSADWHLDSPLAGHGQAEALRRGLQKLPEKIVDAAKKARCDLMLLSGDLFDGKYTPESLHAVRTALGSAGMPVFIAPGNHDFYGPDSPWAQEWPENVHIFTGQAIESVALPALDCRVYGAAFLGPDSPSLLSGFRAERAEKYAVCVLHGDPTQAASPYGPVTAEQVRESGLAYLALGHIHKEGSLRAGSTLCAWPGCPMGRGFDELGDKGVLIVTLDEEAKAEFVPLEMPRFYDLEAEVSTFASVLPAAQSRDFYRVTLVGESEGVDLAALMREFAHIPYLELRDRTVPPLNIWGSAGEDTLEGLYFAMLRASLEGKTEEEQATIRLAARISRQLLNGQEVALP